jgi:hypothetical protein
MTHRPILVSSREIDAEEWEIPDSDQLAAWWRFDEGTGLVIYDHSGNGRNGAWTTDGGGSPLTVAWTVAGFGHNEAGSLFNAKLNAGALVDTTYVTIAAFVKPLANGTGGSLFFAYRLGHSSGNYHEFGWANAGTPFWKAEGDGWTGLGTAASSPTFGTWYFVAYRKADNGGVNKLSVRASGGSLSDVITDTCTTPGNSTTNLFTAFGLNNIAYPMDGGDVWFYSDTNANAYLSDADLDSIYQQFKSRYGMS